MYKCKEVHVTELRRPLELKNSSTLFIRPSLVTSSDEFSALSSHYDKRHLRRLMTTTKRPYFESLLMILRSWNGNWPPSSIPIFPLRSASLSVPPLGGLFSANFAMKSERVSKTVILWIGWHSGRGFLELLAWCPWRILLVLHLVCCVSLLALETDTSNAWGFGTINCSLDAILVIWRKSMPFSCNKNRCYLGFCLGLWEGGRMLEPSEARLSKNPWAPILRWGRFPR